MTKKKQQTVNQSTHEDYFEWWAEEAKQKGLIKKIERAETFEITEKATLPLTKILKTKEVSGTMHLLHPHSYTPDYIIYWNGTNALHDDMWSLDSKSRAFFLSQMNGYPGINAPIPYSLIDTKPDRGGQSTLNSSITFPINQKLMWQLYELYVQKVVLYPATNTLGRNKTLFTETWTPKKLIVHPDWLYKRPPNGKKVGDSKIKWEIKTIEQMF